MPRTVRKEVPRWKQQRGTRPLPGFTPVRVNGRHARQFTRELAKAAAQVQAGEGGKEGNAGGNTLARTGAWRFRRHFLPFAYLACLLAFSAILHGTPARVLWGAVASLAAPALMAGAVRLRDRDGKPLAGAWVRRYADLGAAHASLWLFLVPLRGLRPCLAALLVTWAPFAALWVRRCRWRPSPAEKQAEAVTGDVVTWDKLAARKRWAGQLVNPESIPGGRKWQIELDGTETHIGQILAEPRAIAAAWGKPMTEAYAETHPTGVESRGVLTVLRGGTLEEARPWNGAGFDADGVASIGRFADSKPAKIRILVPMDGTRHGLVAGTSGGGKSEFLNLLIWLALTSPLPIVPVILDPQNGQSLPMWRDKVIYAAGIDECARMVRGLHAGMMDRSRRLASMTWEDDGRKTKGLEFFDAGLTGLPIVMAIMDEAPLLLGGGGNAKLASTMQRLESESAKLARKTGKSKWIVAQVPSLGEMGDQAYRAMLRGGNVVCLRTGEKVSAGMLGLTVDPSSLPQYFPSGAPTQGLGYVVSVDGRQAPFRSDLVPRAMRHETPEVPSLEPEFLEAMDLAMGGVSPTASYAPVTAQVKAVPPAGREVPPQVPSPDSDDAPEGRRCVDAVWQVLSDAGRDMDRGEIISWTGDKARSWERKPWSIKAIGNALRDLVEGKHEGRAVVKPHDGKPIYRAVVSETVSNDQGAGEA